MHALLSFKLYDFRFTDLLKMGLFRSEDMSLCSVYLQAETAYSNIAELGELGIVHFRDVSEPYVFKTKQIEQE
jgi:hypothetical protein